MFPRILIRDVLRMRMRAKRCHRSRSRILHPLNVPLLLMGDTSLGPLLANDGRFSRDSGNAYFMSRSMTLEEHIRGRPAENLVGCAHAGQSASRRPELQTYFEDEPRTLRRALEGG